MNPIYRLFFILCAFLASSTFCLAALTTFDFQAIPLGGAGQDVIYDKIRNLVYVSVPSRNELVVISPATRTITNRYFVGSSPRGMDLSQDNNYLYIALNQAAAIAKVDLRSQAVSEIVVGTQLDSSLAWDVAEVGGNVFVTGSPGSGGFSYVVRVDQVTNAITRVASGKIIRAGPTFLESPTTNRLYIGEGFSPNSLYALDISQPTAPVVLEDNHGTVSGTQNTDISPDGQRIYLSSGQVLRSDTFLQAGSIGAGLPSVTEDGLSVLVSTSNRIDIYSASTFLNTGNFLLPQGSISKHDLFAGDTGMYALSGSTLFLSQVVPEPSVFIVVTAIGCFLLHRKRNKAAV